jgi:hypothetical protein
LLEGECQYQYSRGWRGKDQNPDFVFEKMKDRNINASGKMQEESPWGLVQGEDVFAPQSSLPSTPNSIKKTVTHHTKTDSKNSASSPPRSCTAEFL